MMIPSFVLYDALTAQRVKNPPITQLLKFYPLAFPLHEHLCYCVGKNYFHQKVVEVLKIKAYTYGETQTPHYLIEWFHCPGASVTFWVDTGVALRNAIFQMCGTITFKRSTFIYLPEVGLTRINCFSEWGIPYIHVTDGWLITGNHQARRFHSTSTSSLPHNAQTAPKYFLQRAEEFAVLTAQKPYMQELYQAQLDSIQKTV